jgi:hypothetical protein
MDPVFAADPNARREFFHRLHPSWDERFGLYPVYRISYSLETLMTSLSKTPLIEHKGAQVIKGSSTEQRLKTAERLAQAQGKALIRVDLSQVVSKYIGETEKNLERLFDNAERGGAILYFDEADALFGKRTGVRDSHDRFANMDPAYELAASDRGLTVLIGAEEAVAKPPREPRG